MTLPTDRPGRPGRGATPGAGLPTLADVAARAGVSVATASRVLNGSERAVGEPLRERVVLAAAELGYAANTLAQAVARGSSNLLGLVVHDVADPYFSAIADGVMRQAERSGLVVVLTVTRRDPEREVEHVAMLRAQRARAVIVAGSRSVSVEHTRRLARELALYAAAGGSAACIGQDRLGIRTVLPLNRSAARNLATELHRLGHRRFAVLAGPRDLLTARDRLAGLLDGLGAAGVPRAAVTVLHGPFTRDGGRDAVAALLAAGLRATCLVAVNDVMAVGAMAALADAGVRVPGDVSVAGFDDIPTARDVVPRLTTVRLPLESMGARAALLALEPRPDVARVTKVPGEVMLRGSTAAPPAPGGPGPAVR